MWYDNLPEEQRPSLWIDDHNIGAWTEGYKKGCLSSEASAEHINQARKEGYIDGERNAKAVAKRESNAKHTQTMKVFERRVLTEMETQKRHHLGIIEEKNEEIRALKILLGHGPTRQIGKRRKSGINRQNR